MRYFSLFRSPSISACSFLSSAPLAASSSHLWVFFLASLAGTLCALVPSAVLSGYCCDFFFPLGFVSVAHLCSSLGCPAVLSLVSRQFSSFVSHSHGDSPLPSRPLACRLLVSACVPRSTPLWGVPLPLPASPLALSCLFLWLGFRLLLLSYRLALFFLLAWVVGYYVCGIAFSLAPVHYLPAFGSSPFSPSCTSSVRLRLPS